MPRNFEEYEFQRGRYGHDLGRISVVLRIGQGRSARSAGDQGGLVDDNLSVQWVDVQGRLRGRTTTFVLRWSSM